MKSSIKFLRTGRLCAILAVSLLASVGVSSAQNPPLFARGRILVKFAPEVPSELAHKIIASAGALSLGEIHRTGVHVLKLPANANEKAFAQWLEHHPEVEFAELDALVPPSGIPNDPSYPQEWALPKVSAPAAWDVTTGSSNLTIAIIDTGVDGTHPELAAKMVPGWNFYDNNSNTGPVYYGHGTAAAGATAAIGNNGIGMASLAWGCKIMPIRVSAPDGWAYWSTVANALTWAADHGAQIANVNYQVTKSSSVTSAAQYFQSKGGVVVVPAGNDSAFDSTSDNPYMLTVSAMNPNDSLASWTNTGNNIDLSAPGVNILTTADGGGYTTWSGTCFATPWVTGTVALIMSVNPGLTPTQIQDILKQSADDLGAAGWDTGYGWGRVNAARAVNMALNYSPPPPPPPPPTDTVSPTISITSPQNGTTVGSTIVSVLVNTSDNVGVVKVELYVDGKLTATSTSAPFTTKWNTRKAAKGAHTIQCKAYDAAGNVGTSAILTVSR